MLPLCLKNKSSYAVILIVSLFTLSGCLSTDSQAETDKSKTTAEQVVQADTANDKAIPEAKPVVAKQDTAVDVKTDTPAPAAEKIVLAQADTTAAVAKATADTETKPKEKEEEIIEGKHYAEIFPELQSDASTDKVEVIELFWLACPHCYSLEPMIKHYKDSKPDYVEFSKVPAVLNPQWSSHAKAFYAAQAVDPDGKLKLVDKMFYAIHEQGRRLASESAQKRFFESNGVKGEDFDNAMNSMLMKTNMARAATVSNGSQATGVPAIIIGGKYRTSPYMAGSEAKLLKVIDKLTAELKK